MTIKEFPKLIVLLFVQALTIPRKIRLAIEKPAGENQVAPIKIQVAPPPPLFCENYCKQ